LIFINKLFKNKKKALTIEDGKAHRVSVDISKEKDHNLNIIQNVFKNETNIKLTKQMFFNMAFTNLINTLNRQTEPEAVEYLKELYKHELF